MDESETLDYFGCGIFVINSENVLKVDDNIVLHMVFSTDSFVYTSKESNIFYIS